MSDLDAPMAGDGCTGLKYETQWRGALQAACAEDLDIWPIYAWSFDPERFDETLDRLLAAPSNRLFLLFDGEALAGMSAFLGIDRDRGVLEIGNSYYRPAFRGTGFNRRAKDMMLRRAFDCGFRRVEFRVDQRNLRSQAAMTKLGAVREGVMRRDRITWTGHVRDTVLFSILKDEWNSADS